MFLKQWLLPISRLVGTVLMLGLALGIAAPAQAAEYTVTIGDNFFDPQTLTVNVGDTVTWKHTGTRPHDVTLEGGMFESPRRMMNGQETSFTATTPGTYEYVCTIHQAGGMRATLIVRAAGAAAPATTAAPGMPRTGAGGMDAGVAGPWWLLPSLGVVMALGLVIARRRRHRI